MSILIVTHPHDYENGLIKDKLIKFVKSGPLDSYYIPDNGKEPYGGKNIYNGVLPPAKDKNPVKYGKAPLKDKHADYLVSNHNKVYLAGGYLSECLASTYRSIVRAAERNNTNFEVIMIKDLIYAKKEDRNIIIDLGALIYKMKNSNEKIVKDINDKYFYPEYRNTDLVHHNFVSTRDLISASKQKL